jgi:hypothetical protein
MWSGSGIMARKPVSSTPAACSVQEGKVALRRIATFLTLARVVDQILGDFSERTTLFAVVNNDTIATILCRSNALFNRVRRASCMGDRCRYRCRAAKNIHFRVPYRNPLQRFVRTIRNCRLPVNCVRCVFCSSPVSSMETASMYLRCIKYESASVLCQERQVFDCSNRWNGSCAYHIDTHS